MAKQRKGPVVSLVETKNAPVPEVVDLCAEALKKAKAGVLRSVLILGETGPKVDTWGAVVLGDSHEHMLVGAIEGMKMAILNPDDDDDVDDDDVDDDDVDDDG